MKRLFVAKIILPFSLSLALMVFLYFNENLPRDILVYVALTYFVWLVAAWWAHELPYRSQANTVKSADYDDKEKSALGSMSEVEKYFVRLLHCLDQAAESLRYSLHYTRETTENMHVGVVRAHELAKNTGLLATNAMISASSCGEVGRGFVSVSKDLVKISERSEQDLVQLESLLKGVVSLLKSTGFLTPDPGFQWLDAQLAGRSTSATLAELETLLIRLHGYQEILSEISDHYATTSQLDVRWLQLGEAIKRVINELNRALDGLTESAESFAKEMRILQISDKLSETQLLEIKEGLTKTEQYDKNFEENTG
ncbi:MAG: hypothetical protein R3208_15780 [Ketobacteraceae bacterium]|nr:hypothetical protein [Ketobacteraceae bacterium]